MIKTNIHIVILGAGSTMATIPNGGRNGEKPFTLSSFRNDRFFSEFFESLPNDCKSMDFEQLCEYLWKNQRSDFEKLVELIRSKYSKLQLPQEISILEKLLLSLNPSDIVVSFNWDGLLLQAYNRLLDYVAESELPQLLFPHGNIAAGYNQKSYGCLSNPDNTDFIPSPLNMPIDDLEYKSNRFIQDQWNKFDRNIVQARMITFFGYCGPKSDQKDVDHLFGIFDNNPICAKIEIIDRSIEEAEKIRDKWINHIWKTEVKADLCDSFYQSRMALRPKNAIKTLGCWKHITPNCQSILPTDTYESILSKIL